MKEGTLVAILISTVFILSRDFKDVQNIIYLIILIPIIFYLIIDLITDYKKERDENFPKQIKFFLASGDVCEAVKLFLRYKKRFWMKKPILIKFTPEELFKIYSYQDNLNDLFDENLPTDYLIALVRIFTARENFKGAYKLVKNKNIIKEMNPGDLFKIFSHQNKIDELLEEDLPADYFTAFAKIFYKMKKFKNVYQIIKDKNILLTKFTPEELVEIYSNNNRVDELLRENLPLSYFVNFVRIFVKQKKWEEAYQIVLRKNPYIEFSDKSLTSEERKRKEHDYNSIFEELTNILDLQNDHRTIELKNIFEELTPKEIVEIYSHQDKLEEIPIKHLSKEYRAEIFDILLNGRQYKALIKLLSRVKKNWTPKEYTIWFEIHISKGMIEKALEPLKKINNYRKAEKIFSTYYELGKKFEKMGKIKEALAIYEKFASENILYKDTLRRYVFLLNAVRPEATQFSNNETMIGRRKIHEVNFDEKYSVFRELGRGGMGIVYEAINKKLGKKVALKKMREELAINPREKERFLKEARRVAELHHPHIVDIYDVIEEGNDIYLVFEFVAGKTIEEILNEKRKIEVKEAIEIIKQVCEALKYAHSKGIIHRDIKPSNIIVDNSGWVKVMDFGIAREAKDTFSRISGKDTSGTLAYMSPEQHLGQYDERSDIYSLGVMLYEMLTGELPFKGPDFYTQKKENVYKRIKDIIPEIPEPIGQIIEKSLHPEKEKRFNDIDTLMRAFRR